MKKGRAALGLAVAVIGVVVTRVGPALCTDTNPQMVIYMLGVLLGLGGLGVIAFSLTVTEVKMTQCPDCFAMFEPKYSICPRCSNPLPVSDSATHSPQEKTDELATQLSSDSKSVK